MIQQLLIKSISGRTIVENFESLVKILLVDSGDEPILSAGEKPRSGFQLWWWLYVYERCGIAFRPGKAPVGERGHDSLGRCNPLRP